MKIILGEGFISGDSLIYKVWHSNHWKTTRQFGVRSKLYISIVWDYSVLLFWFHCCSFKKINMFNFQKNMFLIYTWDYCPYFQSRRKVGGGGWGGGCQKFRYQTERGGILLKLRIFTRGNEGPNFRQKTVLRNIRMIPFKKMFFVQAIFEIQNYWLFAKLSKFLWKIIEIPHSAFFT